MNSIEIYVSSRIDQLDSVFPDNDLFIQSFCGADLCKDKSISHGDNTSSDNISSKKNQYCEFTVQYDAWKTSKAEYVGLCHYRRFLIFNEEMKLKLNPWGQQEYFWLTKRLMKKIGILDIKKMKNKIMSNDFIVNCKCDVRKITTPKGYKNTVQDMWLAHDDVMFEKNYYYMMIDILKRKYPIIYESSKEYLNGYYYRGFNCYVMKKKIFDEMNQFEFDILFEVEKQMDGIRYGNQMDRTLGYLGEILYGIYTNYLIVQNKYKYRELPLAMFWNTQHVSISSLSKLNYINICKNRIRAICNLIFPYGSNIRNYIRKLMYRFHK